MPIILLLSLNKGDRSLIDNVTLVTKRTIA